MNDNSATELAFLKGQELFQIAFGKSEVVFSLNPDFISIHCSIEYASGSAPLFEIWSPNNVLQDPAIFRLLHSQIQSFAMNQNEDLKLDFSNGDIIVLRKKSDGQGSYQISCGSEVIVV
ncbi:MAG: hypothetical protein IAF58_18145 [Leptolyngbya sp.]|nr:hypothetical protein [Candidatus Melainabacteria bacterium]